MLLTYIVIESVHNYHESLWYNACMQEKYLLCGTKVFHVPFRELLISCARNAKVDAANGNFCLSLFLCGAGRPHGPPPLPKGASAAAADVSNDHPGSSLEGNVLKRIPTETFFVAKQLNPPPGSATSGAPARPGGLSKNIFR